MAETHDPETGEVLESRAADGSRIPPAASTLSALVMLMRDGQFDADTAEPMQEFATKLEALGHDTSKRAKGVITLKIEVDFDPDREFAVLTPTLNFKLPAEKHGSSVAWFTTDGRLTPHQPRQGQLFGQIREVATQARVVRG